MTMIVIITSSCDNRKRHNTVDSDINVNNCINNIDIDNNGFYLV